MNTTYKRMLEARALREILAANLAAAERGVQDAEIANANELFEKLGSIPPLRAFLKIGVKDPELCEIGFRINGVHIEVAVVSRFGEHLRFPVESVPELAEWLRMVEDIVTEHQS